MTYISMPRPKTVEINTLDCGDAFIYNEDLYLLVACGDELFDACYIQEGRVTQFSDDAPVQPVDLNIEVVYRKDG